MDKKIKIYTTSTCPYCSMLKIFLKEHNVQFEEMDVANSKQALQEMKEKSGQMGVPVLDIEGKIIVGFEKEVISKELGLGNV